MIDYFTKTNFYFYTLRSTFQTYKQKEYAEKDQDSNKVSNTNDYIIMTEDFVHNCTLSDCNASYSYNIQLDSGIIRNKWYT